MCDVFRSIVVEENMRPNRTMQMSESQGLQYVNGIITATERKKFVMGSGMKRTFNVFYVYFILLCGFFYFQSSRMCNVQRDFSMLNVLCSMFKVQVQMFNVQRSMYNVQRLSDIQRCFNVQRLSDIQGCLNGSLILFYFILTV